MHLSRRTLTAWLLLVCVALLATRVAGGHLHLCFDGQEPPISLHSAVEEPHHLTEESVPHSDQDVELPKTALAKWFAQGLDAAALLFVAVLFGLVRQSNDQPRPVASPLDVGSLIRLLRPPLRGPPLPLPG